MSVTFDCNRLANDLIYDMIAIIKGQGKRYEDHFLNEKEMILFFVSNDIKELDEEFVWLAQQKQFDMLQNHNERQQLLSACEMKTSLQCNFIRGRKTGITFIKIDYSLRCHIIRWRDDESGNENQINIDMIFSDRQNKYTIIGTTMDVLRTNNYFDNYEKYFNKKYNFIPCLGAVVPREKQQKEIYGEDMINFISDAGIFKIFENYKR